MAEYCIVVKEGVDKQSVVDLFSDVVDSIIGSDRVFVANISDDKLGEFTANKDIESIETTAVNPLVEEIYD